MFDAGIQKHRSYRDEPEPLVKACCAALRVKKRPREFVCFRQPDEALQHLSADALASPRGQDGHSPDMAIAEHARGTDGFTRGVERQQMEGVRILCIVLEFGRNALLVDKHPMAYRKQLIAAGEPAGLGDVKLHKSSAISKIPRLTNVNSNCDAACRCPGVNRSDRKRRWAQIVSTTSMLSPAELIDSPLQ